MRTAGRRGLVADDRISDCPVAGIHDLKRSMASVTQQDAGSPEKYGPTAAADDRKAAQRVTRRTATSRRRLPSPNGSSGVHRGRAGRLGPVQREALDVIAVKLARILAGHRAHTDRRGDLAGSAWLAAGESGA